MENRRIGNHTVCRFLQWHSAADSANEHKNSRMYLPLVDPFQFARARARTRERALMPQKKKRGKKKPKTRYADTIWRAVIVAIIIGAESPNIASICGSPRRYDIFQQAFCRNFIDSSTSVTSSR